MIDNYNEGFKDCIEHFEVTINDVMERLREDSSYEEFVKSMDSIIATLYITKYFAEVEDEKFDMDNHMEWLLNDLMKKGEGRHE